MLHNRKNKKPVPKKKKEKVDKTEIIKIWYCDKCHEAHFERPVFCKKCSGLFLTLMCTGQITGSEELLRLVEYGKEIARQNND